MCNKAMIIIRSYQGTMASKKKFVLLMPDIEIKTPQESDSLRR